MTSFRSDSYFSYFYSLLLNFYFLTFDVKLRFTLVIISFSLHKYFFVNLNLYSFHI